MRAATPGTARDRQRARPEPGAYGRGLSSPPTAAISARSVGRAASWAGAGHLVSQASWFLSLLALAALVPPRAFGAVAAGMVIVHVATLLVGSGTRGGLITSERISPDQLRYALALNLGTGVLVTAVVVVAAGPIVETILQGSDPWILRFLIASVSMYALSVVPLAVLQKTMQFKREAAVMSGAALAASAAAIAAGILGAGVWSLVLRQVMWATLVAAFAWIAARAAMPPMRQLVGRGRRPRRAPGRRSGWFFVLAAFSLVAMSVDYVIVGRVAGATQLGLYSLAFTLAFAPLTQLSWRLGGVLLPAAAATRDPDHLRRRAVRALRLVALLLLPLIVPAVLLAPWLLPQIFGERWSAMVVPFQILLPVGISHAVLNVVGESLAGSGNVDLHARMHVLWAVLIVPALILLVGSDGIRGAALAHLIVLLPVAAGYLVWGGRRLGLGSTGLARALGGVVAPVGAQLATTLGAREVLEAGGLAPHAALVVALLAGLAVLAGLLLAQRSSPLHEARALVLAVAGRT